MNKVIAAFDGLKISDSTIAYSIYLSKYFSAHIVAAFLADIVYHGREENGFGQPYEENDWTGIETYIKKEELIRKEAIKKVQQRLDAEGVHYNIHRDEQIAIQSLIKESHFADMILIDCNESFSTWDKSKPSRFIRNLLADADCPLMIVPKEAKPIEKFVFAYDGSPASVYAIRHFTYLFHVLPTQQVEIMMVTTEEHSTHFPEHELLKELLKRRYKVVAQSLIRSEYPADAMADYFLSEKKNCMVVLGAYQRSSFSRWLQQSTADILIEKLEIPLFIAHK
jgi:nucleotide-binding universal stress UspA family protein